jgi:hypothetical protein
MTLKNGNIIIGLMQSLLCILTIFPLAISIIKTKGGGFGFGIILLPVLITLCYSITFGIFGFLNYEKYPATTKKWLVLNFIILLFAGLGALLFSPIPIYLLFLLPLAICIPVLASSMKVGKQILFTNLAIFACVTFFDILILIYG